MKASYDGTYGAEDARGGKLTISGEAFTYAYGDKTYQGEVTYVTDENRGVLIDHEHNKSLDFTYTTTTGDGKVQMRRLTINGADLNDLTGADPPNVFVRQSEGGGSGSGGGGGGGGAVALAAIALAVVAFSQLEKF